MPAVAFPDAVALGTTYLRPLVAPVYVGSSVPMPRRGEMLLLRRLGGPRRNALVDQPRIDVQAWAADNARAMALLLDARYHLARICEALSSVREYGEETGPFTIPDPPSDTPRALMTIALSVRGAVPTP